MLDTYYARVCWNSKHWEMPTGSASGQEDDTYVAKDKFGHEEWLFNYAWGLEDGYKYAFLQGVNQSFRKLSGQTINVLLWSINSDKQRVLIGKLQACEVLSETERQAAYMRHEKAGWLKLMQDDVTDIGGNVSSLSVEGLFNIRFKPSNATHYYSPYPLVKKTDRVSTLKRYTLVQVAPSDVGKDWTHGPEGRLTSHATDNYVRQGSASVMVHRRHAAMQNELCKLLMLEYGSANVAIEADWVDLTIKDGKRKMLLEIKPYSSAKQALREALGQILEYGFYKPVSDVELVDLYIVAPGLLDEELSAYLTVLQDTFRLPVRYVQFSIGCTLPQALRRG